MWATGKPHPLACADGCPKRACKAGVSLLEKLEPPMVQVRCPCQRPVSCVSGIRASQTRCSNTAKTSKGKRLRASQYAVAVKGTPAKRDRAVQAVLPCRICKRNT